jgi:predicted transcriptional regulator
MEIKPLIKDDYLVLDENATLSELIGQMKQFEKRTALIFRNKKYLGLIEKKKLLKSKIDPSEVKIKNFIQKTPIINENADIIETAYLMYQSNLEYLPVESNKEIIGVLSSLDLINSATKLKELDKAKVSDVKLIKPKKLGKDDKIATALTIMYKERIDHVPVYDQGKIYGIISFKDVIRKYLNWSPKRDVSTKFNKTTSSRSAEVDMPHLASLPVSSFSTNDNLLFGKETDSLKNATKLMSEGNVKSLLIKENEDLLGLLTTKHLLRKIASLKIPKNYNIKFVGLNKVRLQSYQKYNIQKIASNEAFKLQRKIKNDMNLTIHIKSYDKQGGEQKFSVNLRIDFPSRVITSSQEDWDLETALRKTFNNAKNEVDKKFKK